MFKKVLILGFLVMPASIYATGPITFEVSPERKADLLEGLSIDEPGPNSEVLATPLNFSSFTVDTGICITTIKKGSSFINSSDIQCKQRDVLRNAFAGTAIVLKGMSFVCKFTPHPVLQATAGVWDVGAWMLGTVAFTWSIQPCTKDNDDKKLYIESLQAACYELNKMGLECRGIAP